MGSHKGIGARSLKRTLLARMIHDGSLRSTHCNRVRDWLRRLRRCLSRWTRWERGQAPERGAPVPIVSVMSVGATQKVVEGRA